MTFLVLLYGIGFGSFGFVGISLGSFGFAGLASLAALVLLGLAFAALACWGGFGSIDLAGIGLATLGLLWQGLVLAGLALAALN